MSTDMVERDVLSDDKKNLFFKGFRLGFRVLGQSFEMNPVSVNTVGTVLTEVPTNAEINYSS